MSAPGSAYLTEASSGGDAPARMLSVWAGNLGDPAAMAAKIEWFYGAAPAGDPVVCFLVHAASMATIGVAAAGARAFSVAGERAVSGVLADLAVDRAHRTLFPALSLQKALLGECAGRFRFVYGFPNPQASGVFGRVGYLRQTDLVRRVLPLRTTAYLPERWPAPARALAGKGADSWLALSRRIAAPWWPALEWHDRAPPEADELSRACCVPGLVIAERGVAHYAWRFDRQPGRRYRYALARAGAAAVALFVVEEGDGGHWHVRDWLVRGHDPKLARASWAVLASAARRQGACSLSVEFNGPPDLVAALVALGFKSRDQRPVFWRQSGDGEDLGNLCWYLTAGDEDE